MNKLMIRSTLVAIAASVATPMVANAAWSSTPLVKYVNGVEWRICIDEDAHLASIGTNLTTSGGSDYSINYATEPALSGKWVLPEDFTIDGVNYHVTTLGNRAFLHCDDVTSLTFPSGVGYLYNCVAYGRSKLKSLCFKGPDTVASGTQNTVTLETADSTGQVFAKCSGLKTIFVGPNIKAASNVARTPRFPGSSNYTVFLPRSSDNMTWNAYDALGTNPTVVYYGPNEEMEFKMAKTTLTATVRTASALTNVLNYATTFKDDFELNTRISVTNAIDLTGVTITEQMVSGVTFDRLMFSVKTQAELNNIINTFPSSTPISIDPSEITENLTIPASRKIHVLLSETDAVRLKVKGFMIIVK